MQVPSSWFQGLKLLNIPSVTQAAKRALGEVDPKPFFTEDDLLALAPATTQRLCMNPIFNRVCGPDFWTKKAAMLGKVASTFDEYGVLAMEHNIAAYAPLDIRTKSWYLHALDKRDLDRFRYYTTHSKINPESNYTKTIEWFSYFAGPEFYKVWVDTVRKGFPDPVVSAMIYAFTGETDRFFDIVKNNRAARLRILSYINLAVSGGSLPIVGVLVECHKRCGHALDLDQVVSQANHYDHPEILLYLKPETWKERPPKIYYTRPPMKYGKYIWVTGITW